MQVGIQVSALLLCGLPSAQDVEARLDALRVCLTRLLSDDDDMAAMYLTDKLVHT